MVPKEPIKYSYYEGLYSSPFDFKEAKSAGDGDEPTIYHVPLNVIQALDFESALSTLKRQPVFATLEQPAGNFARSKGYSSEGHRRSGRPISFNCERCALGKSIPGRVCPGCFRYICAQCKSYTGHSFCLDCVLEG